MRFPTRLLACACLAGLASGCATFGTNVEGDFTCRAPKGGCAPTHVIDAKDQGGTLMRQVRRQLKAAQAVASQAGADGHTDASDELSPFSSAGTAETRAVQPLAAEAPNLLTETSDASPLVLPSTAREAVAGAKAPAVEGFDTSPPPRDRAPRPEAGQSAPTFPSAAAIEAAKAAIRPAIRNGALPTDSTSQPKEPK